MKKKLSVSISAICAASACLLSACSGSAPASQDSAAQQPPAQQAQPLSSTGEAAGEITVSVYDTMQYKDFLESAAAAFEANNLGTKINVETFSAMPEIKRSENGGNVMMQVSQSGDDEAARADYINNVNTQIMSGKGADVFALDVLPWYKYAEKGQLEDLGAYMENDPSFKRTDYWENILDAAKYKGTQYFMPINYSFNYFAYDSTLLGAEEQRKLDEGGPFTLDSLIGVGKSAFEAKNAEDGAQTKMFGMGSLQLFNNLLVENYNEFVNAETKKANFTDGKFEGLLNSVKEYADSGYLQPSGQRGQMTMEDMEKQRGQRYFFKRRDGASLLTDLMNNANKASGLRVNMMSSSGDAGNTDDDKPAGLALDADGGASFTTSQAYAINSNSKNKDLAWSFVKYLADEAISNSMMRGLPVNKAAAAKQAEKMVSGEFRPTMPSFAGADNAPSGNGRQQFAGADGAPGGENGGRPFADRNNVPADGKIVPPDGKIVPPDGNIAPPDGNIAPPDGNIIPPDGNIAPPDGNIAPPDGNIVPPGGNPAGGEGQKIMRGEAPQGTEPQELTEEQKSLLNEYMQTVTAYTSKLNKYTAEDETITKLIQTEAAAFFEGSKTATEVAGVLQNRVNLYLNE